jgi:hypothetical protein
MPHGATPDRRTTALKLSLSFALMVVLLLSLVSNVAMNAGAQNSTTSSSESAASSSSSATSSPSTSSNSTDTSSQTGEQVGNNTVSDSSSQGPSDATITPSDSTHVGNMTQTSDEETGNSTASKTDTNSTSTENVPEETISQTANLNETSSNNSNSSLVKISGEPLVQSNSSITRSVTYPTLTFEGMADSEVTMTVTWNTDGSTEVRDSRGYRYLLSVPSSEGTFSLWQNSTVVDQRISGTEKQYDIYWRPVHNSGGYSDRYEFFIAGKSANATTIKLAIDNVDHKNSVITDNKLLVIRPMNQSEVVGSDYNNSYDLQSSTNLAFDNNDKYEPEGLKLDWSDAVNSGYKVNFDVPTSLLAIPIAGNGKPFLIDPYVVGGTNTFISPEIGNYTE